MGVDAQHGVSAELALRYKVGGSGERKAEGKVRRCCGAGARGLGRRMSQSATEDVAAGTHRRRRAPSVSAPLSRTIPSPPPLTTGVSTRLKKAGSWDPPSPPVTNYPRQYQPR